MDRLIQIIFSTKYCLDEFERDHFKLNKKKNRVTSIIRYFPGIKYPFFQFPYKQNMIPRCMPTFTILKAILLTCSITPTLSATTKIVKDINSESSL
jgi:hypothetical protein